MPKELYLIKDMPREAPFRHKVVTLRKARKIHRCSQCRELIDKGEKYCEVVFGGGGLGSLKFPERVHSSCLSNYLEKENYIVE